MAPSLRHRVCARPVAIAWVLGTFMLWIPVTIHLHREGVFAAAFAEFTVSLAARLVVIYASLSGLGFFAGGITTAWLVSRLCCYVNGGPFTVGDDVIILTGPRAGTIAKIYKLTTGQGGQSVARVDLGPEARARYGDIFEQFALLRPPKPPPFSRDDPSR